MENRKILRIMKIVHEKMAYHEMEKNDKKMKEKGVESED
ncbi:unnamed protein product [Paramecium octaurelia]|uniref:Uncharacterized protein n=1 Tax=Paramecium octaurelia TaxID=43137 RepID=A0A8S1XEQ8_PAROT|nr:unnamed protein product [Paramecium octaurelia]